MSDTALVHALAGGVGSSIAFGILYPLDQVRTLLQVDDELAEEAAATGRKGIVGSTGIIVHKYGRGVLWRGIAPVLVSMGISNFIYFYISSALKSLVLRRRRRAGGAALHLQDHLTVAENMVVSTLAGVINVLLTTPLWVANTRIKTCTGRAAPRPLPTSTTQTSTDEEASAGGAAVASPDGSASGGRRARAETPTSISTTTTKTSSAAPPAVRVPSLAATLRSVYAEDGLGGLWAGTIPSLVLVTNPIIQFVAYDYLKRVLLLARGGAQAAKMQLRGHEAFLLGAVAKALATVLTYPLQLAQSKMRATSAVAQKGGLLSCCTGTARCLADVARQRGVPGLFQGMRAKLWHTVLTSSLMFLGYEKIVQVTIEVLEANNARRAKRAAST